MAFVLRTSVSLGARPSVVAARPSSSVAARRLSKAVRPALVVASASASASASADARAMTVEQIDDAVLGERKLLLDLRVKASRKQEFKPHEFKVHKKNIARMLTIKREKEIADGISKKESRFNERMANVQQFYENLPAGTQPRYTQRKNEELKELAKSSTSSGMRMQALEAAAAERKANEEE
ncbi:ribosomal protein L29 [Pseudoscourfieldia marina]